MREIQTPRLLLIPQTVEHAGAMFKVLSDPALYDYENEAPESLAYLQERFRKLESRRSPDGKESWLNWVVQLAGSELIGYVQATVLEDQSAFIAYELASPYWRNGFGTEAVTALLDELSKHYKITSFLAVLKANNKRSLGLLQKLGFDQATEHLKLRHSVEEDELLMLLKS